MESNTLQRKHFLNLLAKKSRSKSKRKLITEFATPNDIKAVAECSNNLLRGNVPLNDKEYRQFYRCRHDIRHLANKRNSIKSKKDIINQRGGFLATLLPLAISAVIELIKKYKQHKKKS